MPSRGSLLADKNMGESGANNMLFVRNIPFKATENDLMEAFVSCGAVRQAFLVYDNNARNEKVPRGFGYVKFWKTEDAVKAKSGVRQILGRPVFVDFADPHLKRSCPKPIAAIKQVAEPRAIWENPAPAVAKERVIKEKEITLVEGPISSEKDAALENRIIRIVFDSKSLYETLKAEILSKLAKFITKVQPPKKLYENEKGFQVLVETRSHSATTHCLMQLKALLRSGDRPSDLVFQVSTPSAARKLKRKLSTKDEKLTAKEEPTEEVPAKKKLTAQDIEKDLALARDLKQFRLVFHNLPFSITTEKLSKLLSKFGEVVEVNLPKKPTGQLRGFAFVQFSNKESAEKALQELNASDIGGRTVAVDWAVPKPQYDQLSKVKVEEVEPEPTPIADDEVKDEPEEIMTPTNVEEDLSIAEPTPQPDIHEGLTVFLRGVSFDSDEASLMAFFSSTFGPVRYARICMDPVTGRSKGTGFVKFFRKEHVEECLRVAAERTGIVLDGRRLTISPAVSPTEAWQLKSSENKTAVKDSRNLNLLWMGYIKAGSNLAEGFDAADLKRREALQNASKAKLKNPNMFVSDVRLSVHNIPKSVDDLALRKLFLQAVSDKSAKISECRIMRERNESNSGPKLGKSAGFGFITFSKHEHALTALKKLNGNDSYFGPSKRLIVQFCVEDRRIYSMKQRRLEKSKEKLQQMAESKKAAALFNSCADKKESVSKDRNKKQRSKRPIRKPKKSSD